MIILDLLANAATNPRTVLTTSEMPASSKVSSQPFQKTSRYCQNTFQLRAVLMRTAQHRKDKSRSRPAMVVPFTHAEAGLRGESRKRPEIAIRAA